MSLRFDRNTPPTWNARTSSVDFACLEPQSRRTVPCTVTRAALEDSTGEGLDNRTCLATFARHLGRIVTVANSIYGAHVPFAGGVLTIDSDDLLEHYPTFEQPARTAHHVAAG